MTMRRDGLDKLSRLEMRKRIDAKEKFVMQDKRVENVRSVIYCVREERTNHNGYLCCRPEQDNIWHYKSPSAMMLRQVTSKDLSRALLSEASSLDPSIAPENSFLMVPRVLRTR